MRQPLEIAFETDRLGVRTWAPRLADAAQRVSLEARLARILTPPVLAPLAPSLQLSEAPDAISRWIENLRDDAQVFTITRKSDSVLIGLLILGVIDQGAMPGEIHVGYLFAQEAWGHGFASELLRALPDAVPAPPGTLLVAGVGNDNIASAKALKKAGFRPAAHQSTDDATTFTLPL